MGWITAPVETLPLLRDEQTRRQTVAERIAARVGKSVDIDGDLDVPVRGGFFGLSSTTHEPAMYAKVAAELGEQGIAIEAHRYQGTIAARMSENALFATEIPVPYDRVRVLSIAGVEVEEPWQHGPSDDPEYDRQLYP